MALLPFPVIIKPVQKVARNAFIMVLIFSGSIFCKVWIYSQTHLDSKSPIQLAYFKKDSDPSKDSTSAVGAWNRLFKSRRRLEKFGFVKIYLAKTVPEFFYSALTLLRPELVQKPIPVEASSLRQPPRLFSII